MKRFVYTFRSQSSADKTYEALLFLNDKNRVEKATCNCPGWTRRTQPDGSRMCVHTRLILSGSPRTDPLLVSCFVDGSPLYFGPRQNEQQPSPVVYPEQEFPPQNDPQPEPERAKNTGRKFNFDA